MGDVRNVIGDDLDAPYILKVSDRNDWDFDKTVNALLDYKEKQAAKAKAKKEEPPKPKTVLPNIPVPPSPISKKDSIRQVDLDGGSRPSLTGRKASGRFGSDGLFTEGSLNVKNIRKLSKDDLKELPLRKDNWNAPYPVINYPE